MATLEVAGLTRRFGDRTVLDAVDLRVGSGGSVAIVGPSGVGKSTLLRCIAGLDDPDAGTIAIDDRSVLGVPAHRRGIGYLFQDQALFPHLDVAGNVAFGLRMHKVPRAQRPERVARVLRLVGLPDAGGRDVATLSGGEAQRVALARALAPEPGVLLLDEPFTGLDRTRRDSLVVELRDLLDELGVTVVAVTHDPDEARGIAHDIAVILDGGVAQTGPAAEVLASPASPAVASLLGVGGSSA